MAWHSWKEDSRVNWGNDREENASPGREPLGIGCLQRIADALERIADCLDPRTKRKIEERADQERQEELDREPRKEWWKEAFNPATDLLRDKLREFGFGGSTAMTLQRKVFEHWGIEAWGENRPTLEEMKTRIDAFGPASFDWSQLRLTKPTVRNLRKVLDAKDG